MQPTFVTNNNLISKINELGSFLADDMEVPEESFIQFINELGVSNLLVPGIVDGDTLNFEVMTSDDDTANVIPLFSDDDEFISHYGEDSEFEAIPNDIRFYIDVVTSNDFDGLLLNPSTDEFFLERELLENLPLAPTIEIKDTFEGYEPEKLLAIAESASNESLVEFLRSGDDHFEALMLELQKAILLNLVVSDNELTGNSDGIIYSEDVGEFILCTTGDGESQFGVLFTSKEKITEGMDESSGLNYYYQIALLDEFFEFVLKSDMDGIIINPGSDDYLIGREVLLEAYAGMTYDNPSFKKAIDCAFLL